MVTSLTTETFSMDYIHFGQGSRYFVILPGISVKPVTLSAAAVESAYADVAAKFRVVLFDRKKKIQPGYTVEDMAEDTASAMRMLGITDAVVFGCSQGGMMAQVLAERHPDLVGCLILSSTLSRQNVVSAATFDEWCRLSDGDDIRTLNRSINEKVYSEAYYRKYREVFAATEGDGTVEEMRRFGILSHACRIFDAYRDLSLIRCPVYAIGASEDRVLSSEGTREIADALGCRCRIYDGYGHAVYDEAEDFRADFLAFLEKEGVG